MADVIVVGGGVAGTFAARELALRGVDVVLLDDGVGGPGRWGVGQGLPAVVEPVHRTAASLGDERLGELLAWSRRSGALLAGHAEPGLVWVAGHPRDHEGLDRDLEVLARHGHRASRGVTPLGEALLLSEAFTVGAARALADVGGRLSRREVRVMGVEEIGGALRVRLADGEVLGCELVVYAGGWRVTELDPWFVDRVVPVREQAAVFAGTCPSGRFGAGWTSFRQVPDGVEVGGCRWASGHLEVGESRPEPTPAVQAKLDAFAVRLGAGPSLSRRSWIEAHTCDGLPLVGPLPGRPRHLALTGFCGNDWGLAPAAAEQLASGLTTGTAVGACCSPSRLA